MDGSYIPADPINGDYTWRQEFYPEHPITFGGCTKTTLEAIEHSLRKWIGLRKENLRKHGLARSPIALGYVSCSLCLKFQNPQPYVIPFVHQCASCPLSYDRPQSPASGICCNPEYLACTRFGVGPEPMIQLLTEARDRERERLGLPPEEYVIPPPKWIAKVDRTPPELQQIEHSSPPQSNMAIAPPGATPDVFWGIDD